MEQFLLPGHPTFVPARVAGMYLNLHRYMNTAMWSGEDILLVAICIVLGLMALAFFVTVFVADFREKRRSSSRRPLRHKNGNSH